MKRTIFGMGLVGTLSLFGCGQANVGTTSAPISDTDLEHLVAPEPMAKAASYSTHGAQYRVLGVQGEPGSQFATVVDTSSWETRNVKVGDLFGRNFKVTAIGDDFLELTTGGGRVQHVAVGQETGLTLVKHEIDDAAGYRGKNGWAIRSALATQAQSRYGLGAQAEERDVFPEPSIALTRVDPGSLFARMGFEEDDLIFSVDGQNVRPEDLPAIAQKLTTPGAHVEVHVFRGGSSRLLSFDVK